MIAEAALEDIPALCRLLEILFLQEADFHPDPAKQAEGLRQIIGRPDAGTILVYREPEIAGMVNLLYTVSTACGGKVAMLDDMIVSPEKRGRRIGSMLLDAAVSKAKSAGCLRITLLTERGNLDAMRFYKRHGFISSNMIPLRILP
ncbi:MAG TPA: GNAT family N-acetyltransferase [Burkholderiales bacterium]|nr:GNAT family N-acetyltransferase [Burkholderiales bacterium]